MTEPQRQLRSSSDVRGSAPKPERLPEGMTGAAVVRLLREPDAPQRSDLKLTDEVKRILQDPLAGLGLELKDDKLKYAGESCEFSGGIDAARETVVYLLYVHPDLVAPEDEELGARNEANGEDFTSLGFLFPTGATARFLSHYPSIPRAFPRLFRSWRERLDIDAKWVPWNLITAIAEASDKVGEAETNLELFHLDLATENADSRSIAATAPPPRGKVFVSYSRNDARLMEEIVAAFQPLEDAEGYEIFTDTEIPPGDRWRERLDAELDGATVMILLVTPSFLASDFIQNNELRPALEAAQGRGLRIFTILVSTTPDLGQSAVAGFQFGYGPPDPPLDQLTEPELRRVLAVTRDRLRETLQGV